MFERIKNNINLFKFGYHASFLDKYEKEIDHMISDKIKYKGYYEVFHTKYVIGNGARFAVLYITKENNLYVPVVVKEKIMHKLSNNVNTFASLHEIGHYKYHIDKNTGKEIDNYIAGYSIYIENQADRFAVEKMGKDNVIKAIQELQETKIIKNNKYIFDQLNQRMNMLKYDSFEDMICFNSEDDPPRIILK